LIIIVIIVIIVIIIISVTCHNFDFFLIDALFRLVLMIKTMQRKCAPACSSVVSGDNRPIASFALQALISSSLMHRPVAFIALLYCILNPAFACPSRCLQRHYAS
jgi:hypothetical protein